MPLRKRFVDQQAFAGVTNRSALRLCVDKDRQSLIDIGGIFKIHMAVAGTGFDDGHRRILYGVLDQPCTAAGISTSTTPFIFMNSVAPSREVSSMS